MTVLTLAAAASSLVMTPELTAARDGYFRCVQEAASRFSGLEETAEAVADAAVQACPNQREEFEEELLAAYIVRDPDAAAVAPRRVRNLLAEVDAHLANRVKDRVMTMRTAKNVR